MRRKLLWIFSLGSLSNSSSCCTSSCYHSPRHGCDPTASTRDSCCAGPSTSACRNPNTGTNDDQVTRGDREWWVRTTISAGPYPDTRRVDIEVGEMRDEDRGGLVYELASLIGKPAQEGQSFTGGQQGGGDTGGGQDLTGG